MPKVFALLVVTLLTAGCSRPPDASATPPGASSPTATPVVASHPLDPLTGVEIEAAARIIRQAKLWPETGMFSTIVLNEPPKTEVLA